MRPAKIRIGKGLALPVDEFIESKIFVVGQSGRGKSGLLKKIEEELVRVRRPFVVFDPAGIAWGIRSSKDGKGPGLQVLVIGGPHGDVRLDRRAGASTAEAIVQANVSAIIDFSEEPKAAYREFLTDFCERIYAINDTSRLIIIDEAKEVVPQHLFGEEFRSYAAVERLTRQGRNKGLGVLLASQRMATVNKDVVTQCGTLFVFGLVGKPDHKTLHDWVEEWSTEADFARFREGLAALKPRECWIWSPQEFSLFKRVYVAEFQTLHPDRTHLRKMGLLTVKPVTTDVGQIVAKLGKQMERMARTKDDKVAADRLRVERDRLKSEVDRLKSQTRQMVPTKPDPQVVALASQRAADHVRREFARRDVHLKAAIERALAGLGAALRAISGGTPASGSSPESPGISEIHPMTTTVHPHPTRIPGSFNPPRVAVERPVERFVEPPAEEDDDQLKAGAVRMLKELASRHPLTLTRSQLGTLAGFTPKGGTFGVYFAKLRNRRFIEEDSHGNVRVTDDGMAFVGEVPPAPQTHDEIMDRWKRSLKSGAGNMLQIVVDAYPNPLTKTDLAAQSGFTADGGTFGVYLSILRRNNLVVIEGEWIRASETLFPGP